MSVEFEEPVAESNAYCIYASHKVVGYLVYIVCKGNTILNKAMNCQYFLGIGRVVVEAVAVEVVFGLAGNDVAQEQQGN